MTKNNIKGIYEISGFGKYTSYEKGCQKMLQAGYEWLLENSKADLKAKSYKNVYGILEPNSPDAKKLSKVICKAVDGEATGAMHQAVMGHLFYIRHNGIEKWKKEVKKK